MHINPIIYIHSTHTDGAKQPQIMLVVSSLLVPSPCQGDGTTGILHGASRHDDPIATHLDGALQHEFPVPFVSDRAVIFTTSIAGIQKTVVVVVVVVKKIISECDNQRKMSGTKYQIGRAVSTPSRSRDNLYINDTT